MSSWRCDDFPSQRVQVAVISVASRGSKRSQYYYHRNLRSVSLSTFPLDLVYPVQFERSSLDRTPIKRRNLTRGYPRPLPFLKKDNKTCNTIIYAATLDLTHNSNGTKMKMLTPCTMMLRVLAMLLTWAASALHRRQNGQQHPHKRKVSNFFLPHASRHRHLYYRFSVKRFHYAKHRVPDKSSK